MEVTGYFSLLVCVLGLVIFLVTVHPKWERIGWHMFAWAMVLFLFCNCSAHFALSIFGKH